MFLEFTARMIAALIERNLRNKMVEKRIGLLCSVPEGRAPKTPTADPLTPVQSQILQLLEIPTPVYGPGN